MATIEPVGDGVSAAGARVVLFDFDGTLSLIRSGWVDVMVTMMVELLLELHTGESEPELRAIAADAIGRLTGRPTIEQMIALAELIAAGGGAPLAPAEYKRRYLERLSELIDPRLAALRAGQAPPDAYLVPGARTLLAALPLRRLTLYLASGTDHARVEEEAALLDIARYFDGGVHGALPDPAAFSKAALVQRIIASGQARGGELLVFGDGPDEIASVKRAGGVAVGVATDEPACREVDPAKRRRLVDAGADFIVPNYLDAERLLGRLFPP